MSSKLRIWVVALWPAGHERNYRREGSAWHKSSQGYYQIFQCLNLLNWFPGNCYRAGLPSIFKAGLKNYRTYQHERASLVDQKFLSAIAELLQPAILPVFLWCNVSIRLQFFYSKIAIHIKQLCEYVTSLVKYRFITWLWVSQTFTFSCVSSNISPSKLSWL